MKAEQRVVLNNNPKQPEQKPRNPSQELSGYRRMKEKQNATTITFMNVCEKLSLPENMMQLFLIFFHFSILEPLPISS